MPADCNQVHDHVLLRTVHVIYLAVDAGFAKVGAWFVEHRNWPAPESLRKEEYVALIVFRTPCRHVHQAECPLGIEESGKDTEGITGARPGGQATAREIRYLIPRMRNRSGFAARNWFEQHSWAMRRFG